MIFYIFISKILSLNDIDSEIYIGGSKLYSDGTKLSLDSLYSVFTVIDSNLFLNEVPLVLKDREPVFKEKGMRFSVEVRDGCRKIFCESFCVAIVQNGVVGLKKCKDDDSQCIHIEEEKNIRGKKVKKRFDNRIRRNKNEPVSKLLFDKADFDESGGKVVEMAGVGETLDYRKKKMPKISRSKKKGENQDLDSETVNSHGTSSFEKNSNSENNSNSDGASNFEGNLNSKNNSNLDGASKFDGNLNSYGTENTSQEENNSKDSNDPNSENLSDENESSIFPSTYDLASVQPTLDQAFHTTVQQTEIPVYQKRIIPACFYGYENIKSFLRDPLPNFRKMRRKYCYDTVYDTSHTL